MQSDLTVGQGDLGERLSTDVPISLCIFIERGIFKVCLFRLADPATAPQEAQDSHNEENDREYDNCSD